MRGEAPAPAARAGGQPEEGDFGYHVHRFKPFRTGLPMTSSQQPPRDESADNAQEQPKLSLAELAKAALAAQQQAKTAYQHRKPHDQAEYRPPHPRGSRRSMGKR